jgi:uncharacterized protein
MSNILVSQLWIYPIKSCKGISLTSVRVDERGFEFDRRFMLVDEEGKMLTQREHPRMTLIETKIELNQLIVSVSGQDSIAIPLIPERNHSMVVKVWDDECEALTISEKINQWFSDFLGFKSFLVYMPNETKRLVDTKYDKHHSITAFSDGFPILTIGELSLQDLNGRLEEKISMERFRPNLVFRGGSPFIEDTWHTIAIEGTQFEIVKPCSRCVVTTINTQTAEKSKEPLKTLATYRNWNGKIMFGQNTIPLSFNRKISIGEEISVLQTKDF